MEVAASFSKWPRGPQLLQDAEATNRPKSPCKPRCFPTHRVLNSTIAPGTATWHQRRHGFYSSLIWFSRGFPGTSSTAFPPPHKSKPFCIASRILQPAAPETGPTAQRDVRIIWEWEMHAACWYLSVFQATCWPVLPFQKGSEKTFWIFLVEFIGVLCLSHSIAKVDKSYLFDAVSSYVAMCIYSI